MRLCIIKSNLEDYDSYVRIINEQEYPIKDVDRAIEIVNQLAIVTNGVLNVDIADGVKFDSLTKCHKANVFQNLKISGQINIECEYNIHLSFRYLDKVVLNAIPFLVIFAGGVNSTNKDTLYDTYIKCGDAVVINPTSADVYELIITNYKQL